MGLPRARKAQPFYRVAKQRFEDAQFLLQHDRTTGAVYLAGYGVECILKALIIDSVPAKNRDTIISSFRGARGHDFEWLKEQYQKAGGAGFPIQIQEYFTTITWTTDLRYQSGMMKQDDAEAFLAAAEAIINWADRRM